MAFFRHHAEGKEVNLSRIIPPGELAVEFFFHGISVIGMDHREEGAAGVFREVFVVVTFQKVHHHLVGKEDFSFFRGLHHQNATGEMVGHIGKVEAELGPFVSNRNGAVKLAPAGLAIELGAVKGIVGANAEIAVGIALFRIGSAAQGGIKFHFPLPGHEGMGSLGKIIHGSGNGAEVLVGAEKNEFIAAISGDDGFFAEGFPHIPDQRFQGFVAYVGQLASDFFFTQLGVAGIAIIFFNMDRSKDISLYQILIQQNGVLVVIAFPGHISNDYVVA